MTEMRPPAQRATAPDPGFRIREDHIDGSVTITADVGVSAGRLVDKLSLHTRIAAVLADVEYDEENGRVTMTFVRPQSSC